MAPRASSANIGTMGRLLPGAGGGAAANGTCTSARRPVVSVATIFRIWLPCDSFAGSTGIVNGGSVIAIGGLLSTAYSIFASLVSAAGLGSMVTGALILWPDARPLTFIANVGATAPC